MSRQIFKFFCQSQRERRKTIQHACFSIPQKSQSKKYRNPSFISKLNISSSFVPPCSDCVYCQYLCCCRVLDCPRCDICPCSRCIILFKWNQLTLRIETVSGIFPAPGVYISLCRGEIYTPGVYLQGCISHFLQREAFSAVGKNIHPCILYPPLSIFC